MSNTESKSRRAELTDLEGLVPLVRAFYLVDRHEFDEATVRAARYRLATAEGGDGWRCTGRSEGHIP